ncbi:hypothetical protein GS614_08450 [Ruegeria sp. HKCCD6604]|nr:hypothetical protein [Ruegeria sp. HKCCD6604]
MTKPQTTNPERVADSLPFIKQHILRRLGMSALGSILTDQSLRLNSGFVRKVAVHAK